MITAVLPRYVKKPIRTENQHYFGGKYITTVLYGSMPPILVIFELRPAVHNTLVKNILSAVLDYWSIDRQPKGTTIFPVAHYSVTVKSVKMKIKIAVSALLNNFC